MFVLFSESNKYSLEFSKSIYNFQYKYKSLVTLELMYPERPSDNNFDEIQNWTSYIDHYVNSDDVDLTLIHKPVFLKRLESQFEILICFIQMQTV